MISLPAPSPLPKRLCGLPARLPVARVLLSNFHFACIVANMAASTVAQYLAALPADRRAALSAVRKAINENLPAVASVPVKRSEERRVGKECRSRWSRYH